MFKKTLKVFLVMVVVFSLALGFVLPTRAQAAWNKPVNYTDLNYTVRYGNEVNIVRYDIPYEHFMFQITSDNMGSPTKVMGKDFFYFFDEAGDSYFNFEFFPLTTYGLILENVPVGTKLHIGAKINLDLHYEKGCSSAGQRARYMDANYKWLSNKVTEIDCSNEEFSILNGRECFQITDISLDYIIEHFPGAKSFVPAYRMADFYCPNSAFTVTVSSCYIEMEVSVDSWAQFQAQQNGEKLGEIKDELGNVNDKLEDTNEKLEELPGEIGDEMQGIIDKENDKAESSGNKFVNQILDALPDPSTEVLSSLKSLTDATAYTGTDAKLKIPALVIPAVDGLFPETEIWGGTEFSFSDYLSFLPPALLTVVQSLFTIAIVLFCVYELKGIISYCLTLNDKKGG